MPISSGCSTRRWPKSGQRWPKKAFRNAIEALAGTGEGYSDPIYAPLNGADTGFALGPANVLAVVSLLVRRHQSPVPLLIIKSTQFGGP
jgi:hypothetical protein